MKKSPMHPNFEMTDYDDGYSFDPQVDFSQFLEEARKHAREKENPKAPSPITKEDSEKRTAEEKKIKKSWKSSLLSWWKVERKSKPIVQPMNGSHGSKPKKHHVSGPIYETCSSRDTKRQWRQMSGPITRLLNPSKRVESEIPYVGLHRLNKPHDVKAYGPVYSVT